MKTTHILGLVFCIVMLGLAIVACTVRPQDKRIISVDSPKTENQRIISVEHDIIHGVTYSIISVDGHEYLTSTRGGFIELDKK